MRYKCSPPCYACGRPSHLANTCPQWERNYGPRSGYQAAQKTVRQPSPYHYYASSVAQPAVAPQLALPLKSGSTKPESTSANASQPFRFRKAVPAIVSGAQICAAYNQSGRCVAGCSEESHRCNRKGSGEPHPGIASQNFPLSIDEKQLEVKLKKLFVPLPNSISTPVNVENLTAELQDYPFPDIKHYLLTGFRNGFCLGYTGPRFSIVPKNLRSALDNPTKVSEAIVKELEHKHIAGPFEVPPIHPLHCSPLGAVPKKHQSWRLILDLSSPKGKSVNEHISREDYSVTFTKFDDAVYLVKKAGKGELMAKLDIKHAFRIVPVYPDDWDLLGTCWQGQFYVELHLPFGCRSSVVIFNTFADTLAWILRVKYLIEMLVHYLDDFFTCGKANTSECARNIEIICNVFASLGVPLAHDKLIGPITCLVYLGTEIDSVAQVIQLPHQKFQDLVGVLNFLHQRKKCTKRELLSLIGKLSFAAKVIRPGRIFLQRLIDLSTSVSE